VRKGRPRNLAQTRKSWGKHTTKQDREKQRASVDAGLVVTVVSYIWVVPCQQS
jgi:hypothetical protein